LLFNGGNMRLALTVLLATLTAALFPEESCLLIQDLKGITLVGDARQLRVPPRQKNGEAVNWNGMKIPGHPEDLQKKLSSFLGKPVTSETLGIIKRTIVDYYMEMALS
jgi:hypothetical protein